MPPLIYVHIEQDDKPEAELRFPGMSSIHIGRSEGCEVKVDSVYVSRRHARIAFERGHWYVCDEGSTNGTYLNGEKIRQSQREPLERQATLRLTSDGPLLHLTIEGSAPEQIPDLSMTHRVRVLLSKEKEEIKYVLDRQRQKYIWVIVALSVFAVASWMYQVIENGRLRGMARDMVVEMKELDVNIARVTQALEANGPTLDEQLAELERQRRHRQELEDRYDVYVRELGVRRKLTPEEKVIYKMAYLFNESESEIPAAFIREVQAGIDYWKHQGRRDYVEAIRLAEQRGYTKRIVQTMQAYGLPPHFFYIAMQESLFDLHAVGPLTNYGYAKGMWQFIPTTARKYDLDVGNLWNYDQYVVDDQRFDFERSTEAAARYLRYIYSTLTQASGLLVIASYNWGEHRIYDKLERLSSNGPDEVFEKALEDIPNTTRDRSYWKFYSKYRDRMPEETKKYVVRIFSAAVIGEDPHLFGFDFDNPLQRYVQTSGL